MLPEAGGVVCARGIMKTSTMSPFADKTWPTEPERFAAYIRILRSLAGDLHFNRRLTECLGVIRRQVD